MKKYLLKLLTVLAALAATGIIILFAIMLASFIKEFLPAVVTI